MTNEKIEALKKQLDMYSDEIAKYRKEFLANDGKIDAEEQIVLDNIRRMLNLINTKIASSNKSIPDDEAIKSKVHSLFQKLKTMVSKQNA